MRLAVVAGVANHRSLAWSSALSLIQRGGFDNVVITCEKRFLRNVENIVEKKNEEYLTKSQFDFDGNNTTPPPILSCLPCDLTSEMEVEHLFGEGIPSILNQASSGRVLVPRIDAVIHSVAKAPSLAMKPDAESDPRSASFPLLYTTADDFNSAHDASSRSLITLVKHALPFMSLVDDNIDDVTRFPSVVALTYLGSSQVVPGYNVMGPAKASLEATVRGLALEIGPPPHCVRVNAVSAGPINTLSARGIHNFHKMKDESTERSLLRKDTTADEVADVVAFLADTKGGSRGITGQVIFCDGGRSSFGG